MNASTFFSLQTRAKSRHGTCRVQPPLLYLKPLWCLLLVLLALGTAQSQDCEGSITLVDPFVCDGASSIDLLFDGNGSSTGNYNLSFDNTGGVIIPTATNIAEGATITIDISGLTGGIVAGNSFTITLSGVESTNGSCTTVLTAVDQVDFTVQALPIITATNGDMGTGNEDLICNGEASDIELNATTGMNVDYVITAVTPLNVNGTLAVNAVIGNSANDPVNLPAPSLNDANLSGQVTYEITPRMGNCQGSPITASITIEPDPTIAPIPTSPVVLCLSDITGTNDVSFTLSGPTDPSSNSLVRYRLETTSVITDPNSPAAGVSTSQLSGTLPVDFDGSPDALNITNFTDGITVANPGNMTAPVTIAYVFRPYIRGNGSRAVCDGSPITVEYIIQPEPNVSLEVDGNAMTAGTLNDLEFCSGSSIDLAFAPNGGSYLANTLLQINIGTYTGDASNLLVNGMAAPMPGSNFYFDPTITAASQTFMTTLTSTECLTMNLIASAFIDVNQNGTYEAGTDCLGSSYPLTIEFRPTPQMEFTEDDGQTAIANPLSVCEVSTMGSAQVAFTLAGPTIACDDCLIRYRLIGTPVINDPNLGATYDDDGGGAFISNSQTGAINFDAMTPGIPFTTTFTDDITIAQSYDFHEAATITYQFRSWIVCNGTALCFGPIETMVAEIVPAPKVRLLDGTTSLDLPTDGSEVRTVCNGDEEDLVLRVRSNFTQTVTYDITGAAVSPAGALEDIWLAGSTVAAATNGTNLPVQNPSLAAGFNSGRVDYTIVPRNTGNDCLGEAIQFSIIVTEDPDVFVAGSPTETLCSGFQPTFELRTNFVDPSQVLYDVDIISATDLSGNLTFDGGTPITAVPTVLEMGIPGDQMFLLGNYFFAMIQHSFENNSTQQQMIELEVRPRLPLPDGPCVAAVPLQLTLLIDPLTENVFTSFSRNHPFLVCSGDSSDMTIDIDPLFVDAVLGEGYEVALTLSPMPVINASNPSSTSINLPAPTTVVFNDDSADNLSHTIMDEFINLSGDYALVRYDMTAVATNPAGGTCSMALPQPPIPFFIRIAPEPVLTANDQEICSGGSLNVENLISDNTNFSGSTTPGLPPTNINWQVAGGMYPAGISEMNGMSSGTFNFTAPAGAASVSTSLQLMNSNTMSTVVSFEFTSTNQAGCIGSTTVNITVNPTPMATLSPTSQTVCEEATSLSFTFTATTGEGPFTVSVANDENGDATFTTLPDFTGVSSGDELTIDLADLENNGMTLNTPFAIRLLEVIDANACQQTGINQDVEVTINEAIDLSGILMSRNVCETTPRVLQAREGIEVTGGQSPYTYSWTLIGPGILDTTDPENPVYDPDGTAPGTAVSANLTVMDANGVCSANKTIDFIIFENENPVDPGPVNTCTSDPLFDLTTLNGTVSPAANTVNWFDGDPDNGGILIDPANNVDLSTVNNGLWTQITNGPCSEAIPITLNFNDPDGEITVDAFQCAADGTVDVIFDYTGATAAPAPYDILLQVSENNGSTFTGFTFTDLNDGETVTLVEGTHYSAATVATNGGDLIIRLQTVTAADACTTTGIAFDATTTLETTPDVIVNGGTPDIEVTVCNGDEANLELTNSYNPSDNVRYLVLVSGGTNLNLGVNPFDANGGFEVAPAGGTALAIPTPTLLGNASFGTVTYTIIPRTQNASCEGEAISVTINVETDPDVFPTGFLTEQTLCSGGEPSFELRTTFADPSMVLYDVEIISAGPNVVSLLGGGPGITVPTGVISTLNADEFLFAPSPSYYFTRIPDELSLALTANAPESVVYRVTPRKTTATCSAATPIDFTVTIIPMAENVLTITNNADGICSGDSSNILIEVDPFFVSDFGGNHEVQLTIKAIPVDNASHPISSQVSVPDPVMVVFNNDNVNNLEHTITDLLTNTFGDYARIDYQLCATVLDANGTIMCDMVITEATNGDLLDVRVFPEPVLSVDPVSICSGEDLNLLLNIEEDPISNNAALPALTPISADWEVVGGYPMGITGTAGVMGTSPDISTGFGVPEILTNTTNAPVTIFYQFTPSNDRNCLGEATVVAVTIEPEPSGTIALIESSACDGMDFQVQFTANSGTGPFTIRLAENSNGTYQILPDFTMVNSGDILTIAQSDLASNAPGTFNIRLNRLFDANTCDSEFVGTPVVAATIQDSPQIDILAASRMVCQEATRPVNINVTGGSGMYNYTWAPSNLFTDPMALPPATFDAAGLAAGTYPITVTATDATTACSDTEVINVMVESLPNVNVLVSSNTICEGEMVTLTFDDVDDTGMTFSISGNISDDLTNVPFSLNNVTDAASLTATEGVDFNGSVQITNLQVSVENPPLNCGIDLADININVIPAPSISFNYNMPTANLGSICSGEGLDIAFDTDAPGTEGVDYVFIVDAIRYETPTSGDGNVAPPGGLAGYGPLTGGNLTDGMDNIVMGGILESLANTSGDQVRISYRVFTRLLGSACEGNPAWINAIIDPAPTVSFDPAGPFCIDDAATTLTASPAGGTFSGNGITDATAGTFDPATAGLGSHTITYAFTDPTTMCTGEAEITIVVGPEIDFSAAGPFCADAAAINLTASPTGGTFSGNGITDGIAGTFDPAIAGAGMHTIDYTYTDPTTNCTGTASINIQVNALPVVTLDPAGPLCTNDVAFDLTASPSGGTYSGMGITDMTNGTFDPATAGTGSHIINYTFTDTNGCSAIASITIVVNMAPSVSLAAAGPFCIDDVAVNLNGTPTGGMYEGNGITDATVGTFDPATAGVGTHTIRYFLTDANNCSDTTSTDVVVNSCQDPTITNNDPSIDDPCMCIGNGQFSEEVLISSDPGETWTITATNLIDPNTMMPYPMGFVIPETPAGSGMYVLNGIHLDGIGYTLTAESAMQPLFPLTISNTCYYPDPVIEALMGYCMDADPVTVIGHAGGEAGTGSFVLNNTPLPTFEVPVGSGNWQATFDPSNLIITTHTLTFTFDADTVDLMNNDSVACVATVSEQFEISGDQGDLECAALINVSVDANCMATLDPDVILQGNDVNNDLFLLEIFVNGQSIGNTVNGSHVGDTLEVRVTDLCSAVNNFCWGNIFVEDKIDPVIDCQPVEIWCNEDPSPSNPLVGFPTINDTCDPNPDTSFVDVLTDFSCTESALYSAMITRTWTVCDDSNNCTTCDQEIFLRRAMTSDITLPPNYDDLDQPAFSCSDPTICLDPTLACTGVPTINGIPVDGGSGFCELNVASSDDTLFVDAGSFKILRTWTIINWCNSNDILQQVQVIKVEDDEDPTITCPADFTTGTSANACEAIVILPAAQVSDNCSPLDQITVQTFLGNQLINGNGGNVLLPLGTHTITYVATDDSGNSSTCDVAITVEDDIIPAAVCNADITVGLTLNEPTLVNAITFDDGSHDNCSTDLQFAVRRMDAPNCPGFDATDFASTVPFFCCDVGNVVMVELQVTDEVGNSNTCMAEVQVQDKLAPALICPANKTIDCSDDLTVLDGVSDDPSGAVAFFVELTTTGNDTTFVGYYADVFDNCGAVVYIKDEGFIDNCGISVDINGNPAPYNRIYVAVDPSGNVKSCTQQISVENLNPFQLSNISFPVDITLDGCLGANIDPSVTGRPIYNHDGCSIIADTLKDQTFTFVDGVCVKILRTWTVIDWCTFDASDSDFNDIPESTDDGIIPGYFQDLQIIKVLDSEAPQITSNCNDVSFDGQGPACNGFASLQASADDCAPDAELNWTYRIDTDNDGNFDGNGVGNDASGTYPVGTHLIEWTVEDGCGNSSSCDYLFTINDAVIPQSTCINETVSLVAPSNEGVLWTSDVIIESGTFDNCPGTLTYSFSPNTIQTGMTFNCDSVGDRTIRVYVTDAAGNQTSCTSTITVQANAPNQCQSAPMASVSGSIKDEEGEEVQYVAVDAGYGLPYMTDMDGLFLIDSLPMYANYMVTPERDDDPLNGVSTYDVLLMSMHILGLQALDSPYKIIAADVNRSGDVTAFDMVELRKLILFINSNFTDNTSWRFVDESFLFPDPTNPFSTIFPEEYLINDLENSMTGVDFVAIKTGDLNNSASPHQLQGGDTRTDGRLSLVMKEQNLEAGQEYTLPVYAKDVDQLYGYQLTLGFDPAQVEMLEVESAALPDLTSDNFGWQFVEQGILTSSWASPQAQRLEAESPLFYLKLKAKQDGALSSMLYLSPRYTPAEAYAQLGERLALALTFDNDSANGHQTAFALYQNRPNPFKDETVIGFTLPTNTNGSLRIYDVSGRLLKAVQGQFAEGYNEIIIDQSELLGSGLLYYQLDTPTHTATKKMTLLRNE